MSLTHTEVLSHLEALVAYDTRNPPRAIRAGGIDAYITRNLKPAGFAVAVESVGTGCLNILATRGNPHALFNVHLDTVPDAEGWSHNPLRLRVVDGKAIGLGACDVKGSAAALIAAATSLPSDVPVAILFTTDEEHGSSTCVRTFLSKHADVQLAVVAEPTGNSAAFAHRGLVTATFVASGTAGHASQSGIANDSAIHRLTAWCSEALAIAATFDDRRYGLTMSGIRFNIGRIEGGTKANMVASSAAATVGIRPLPDQSISEVLTPLCKSAETIGHIGYQPGFLGPPLAEHIAACNLAQRASIPTAAPVDFWTEAALFAEAGIPAFVLGPGSIEQAHVPNEWISLAELDHAVGMYARLMTTLAQTDIPSLEN